MLNPVREVHKRRVRLRWSCCNTCLHEHRFFVTAWICGRIQYFWREVLWGLFFLTIFPGWEIWSGPVT